MAPWARYDLAFSPSSPASLIWRRPNTPTSNMRVLVVGGGGREHALWWKMSQSPLLTELYCTPGNPGIAELAQCIDDDAITAAKQLKIDLAVIGPEVPLAEGIVDTLEECGIAA